MNATAKRPEPTRWPGGMMLFLVVVISRTIATVLRGETIGAFLWPILVAAFLWLAIAFVVWEPLTALISGWILSAGVDPTTAAATEGTAPWWAVALSLFLKFAFWLGLVPLVYVTALMLIALWTLPGLIRRIAQRDYPNLTFRYGGSLWGSIGQTLLASSLFLLGLIGTILLWWLPGALVLFPFLLTAWLNQRTFVYDCLSEVADASELTTLPSRYRGWFFAVGVVGAFLAWLPFVNLFSPLLVGLLFTHATLELLRWERENNQSAVSESITPPSGATSNQWELLP